MAMLLGAQNYVTAWLKAIASGTAYFKQLLMGRVLHIYNMLPWLKTKQRSLKREARVVRSVAEAPFLSFGGSGLVYKLSDGIAVKISRPDHEEFITREQKIFEILNRQPVSPYIIQHFHNTPTAIFLEYVPGGTLHSILTDQQVRDEKLMQKVLRVEKLQTEQDCVRWMRQLAAAAAWLEMLGLAHCDIRPVNMLLSAAQNVKLVDFDHTRKIGQRLDYLTEPFARMLGDEAGEEQGTFGKAGCQQEQFAIGSVLYTLTRGHEPYELEWWGHEHWSIVDEKLKNMEFPVLGSNEKYDDIIGDCWHGRYESIAQLAEHLASLDHYSSEVIEQQLSASDIESRKHECEMLVQSGILEKLDCF
ncbi:hypothetical protein E4U43_001167 [Claviceps pusilla]|uniref:Protein kinase domain-containing protein n=1 Tax=Claviceps pusilla TaxID=123648 RepID=A0A9P7N8S5_9HYPO|nr:hypothetical protein E4U43_001167 [Claviceps pusilla]